MHLSPQLPQAAYAEAAPAPTVTAKKKKKQKKLNMIYSHLQIPVSEVE